MSAPSLDMLQRYRLTHLTVSFRFLLVLYAIVPLCLLIQFADQFMFAFRLRELLPSSPNHFLLFQVLFGTPHIIASNILLISHAEYRHRFKQKFIGMSLFIVLFFGVGSLFIPYRWLYIISVCWTVYHVLKQQHGVAKAVCRLPPLGFYMQLGLSVGAGICIYLGTFLKDGLDVETSNWVLQIAIVLTVGLFLSTCVWQARVTDRFGQYFLWANSSLVISCCYFYAEHYYFLAILMPRLVHDLTAFSFYISHDVNRHAKQADNALFRLTQAAHIPVVVVLPVLAFSLTWFLQQYGDALVDYVSTQLFSIPIYKAVTLGLFGYLALMHYYTEGFVWSSGSPLRRYITFSH
jgi:hypothetical protein